MTTAVYASRFAPALYGAREYEKVNPEENFHLEMARRLLSVKNSIDHTKLLRIDSSTTFSWSGPIVSVVGITRHGDPYLFRRLYHSGRTKNDGTLELLDAEGAMGEVEVGIFGDPDFVSGVKARMETSLPPWIETGETRRLYVWKMEDVYAIASRNMMLFG